MHGFDTMRRAEYLRNGYDFIDGEVHVLAPKHVVEAKQAVLTEAAMEHERLNMIRETFGVAKQAEPPPRDTKIHASDLQYNSIPMKYVTTEGNKRVFVAPGVSPGNPLPWRHDEGDKRKWWVLGKFVNKISPALSKWVFDLMNALSLR